MILWVYNTNERFTGAFMDVCICVHMNKMCVHMCVCPCIYTHAFARVCVCVLANKLNLHPLHSVHRLV